MAGPRPDNPLDNELVEISLLSGRSARPSISFTPGAPAPTVSVGSVGQWSVTAEGVEPIHVFLAFDGQTVHVAAALPESPVLLAGGPVGTKWTRAAVPCELRFGGACLILRRVPRPSGFAQEEATMHDGGALLLAAQQRASQTPAPVTQPLGQPPGQLGQTTMPNVPSVRPAAGMPPDTARTAAPSMSRGPALAPGAPDMGSTVPLADPHGFHEAVLAATAGGRGPSDSAPTQIRAPIAGPPQPPPLDWEKTVVAPHPPGYEGGYQGGVPLPPPPAVAPPFMQAPPPQPPQMPTSPTAIAATTATTPPAASHAALALQQLRAQMLASWRASSPAKKATMVLMPFALVAAVFIMNDDPPPTPSKATRPAASALAKAGADAGTLTPTTPTTVVAVASLTDAGMPGVTIVPIGGDATTTNAATPPSPDATAKVAVLPTGKRTPEREALDTTAAGAFDDAAKRYDVLATVHPDDPSYSEAARILRAKAQR